MSDAPTAVPPEARILELEAEVSRLRGMLASAPSFVTHISVDGEFLYLNKVSPGFRMDEVLGTSVLRYLAPEFHDRAREAMRVAAETRQTQSFPSVGRVSVSELGHYVTHVAPVIDELDAVTSLVMIATDVSELMRARADLDESRTHLAVAVESTGLGIWTFDPASQEGSWDATAQRIFGEGDGPAPDLPALLAERVHPEDRWKVRENIERALAGGAYGPVEHRIVLPGGEVRWVAASGRSVQREDGSVRLIGGVRDVTEHRALEARLLEAQKLEGIGRLAGGVAHDFNNLLTVILGNLDLALQSLSPSPAGDARSLLEDARLAAERSAALTAQLLAFARRQKIDPEVVDPSALVTRLEALLRRLLGERLRLVLDAAARGFVHVDPSQLEQVVLNLVTNGRDAMVAAGTLTLRTADVVLDASSAAAHDVAPGPYVRVEVRDTGGGISPADLPHIFEPFFSTRTQGTGLGLATCYGIVKQNRGFITVESALAEGSTFSVYLPVVQPAPHEEAAGPAAAASRGEAVLVVEDEPLVRHILTRTLEVAGYQVTSAASPDEAFALLGGPPPRLLVTDFGLSGMDGRQLAERLLEGWPQLRVLYISGYGESAVAQLGAGPRTAVRRYLQKPFLPSALLGAVRELLDAR